MTAVFNELIFNFNFESNNKSLLLYIIDFIYISPKTREVDIEFPNISQMTLRIETLGVVPSFTQLKIAR